MNIHTAPMVAPDFSNPYWKETSNVDRQMTKEALLNEIVDVLPDRDMIQRLHEVFVTRCQSPLGNVFHTPTFLKQADVLYMQLGRSSTQSPPLASLTAIPMDLLACHLLAVSQVVTLC